MTPSSTPQDIQKALETLASIHTLITTLPTAPATEKTSENPEKISTLQRRLTLATQLVQQA